MASFKAFEIAGSGMSAQSVRLNTTASNLANAESVSSTPEGVYKARHPIYEPGNPLADANGYVYAPAVNVVEEMVNMISASRSYQNNVEVMNTSKDLLMATLRLGQG